MASFEEDLAVARALTDKRAALTGEQVIAVVDMTYGQRVELLAELIEQAHAAALDENREDGEQR